MIFKSNIININKNQKIIEIVSCDSALGWLKRSNFKDNLIVHLPLQLSFGDLKPLDNYDRSCLKELIPSDAYFFFDDSKEEFIFFKEMEELKKYILKADKIRVWSSHKSADEFLLFIYICYLFPNKNISVVYADEYDSYCWSIGCMTFREINELSKKEHILSKKEIANYANKWKDIVKENSALRYIEDGQIKSVSIDYFDEIIISYLGNGEIKLNLLVAQLMGNAVIDHHVSDAVYVYLINRLIEQGKIEVVHIDKDGKKIIRATVNN